MRIFLTNQIIEDGVQKLKDAGHEIDIWINDHSPSKDELIERASQADALWCMLNNQIDADIIRECSHLKIISNYAVGYNNIKIEEATKSNIPVSNTPGVLTNATAELAVNLTLMSVRRSKESLRYVRDGHWKNWGPKTLLGSELTGKTLGIYGFGRIGQRFAEIMHYGFGMNILYCARTPKTEIENKLKAKKVELEELLKNSDLISLHCDLNPTTENLFDKDKFAIMKPSAHFINTARGGCVVEDDLIDALKNQKIAGAALDVTNPEPIELNNELLKLPNCHIIPHLGSATTEARTQMSLLNAESILAAFENREIPYRVN